MFSVISDFVVKNNFGISVDSLDCLEKNHSNLLKEFDIMRANIINQNKLYTYEKKMDLIYQFYSDVIENYHKKKLIELSK